MRQIEPTFGKTVDTDVISSALNLDLSSIDSRFPVGEVSAGLPCIIVPLKTLNAVKKQNR